MSGRLAAGSGFRSPRKVKAHQVLDQLDGEEFKWAQGNAVADKKAKEGAAFHDLSRADRKAVEKQEERETSNSFWKWAEPLQHGRPPARSLGT